MIWDYFKLALDYLTHRKLRAWLTVIGIVIGIAAIVSLISLGQGMQDAISEQFKKVGTNKIMVTQRSGLGLGAFGGFIAKGLTDHDLNLIRKINGISRATGVNIKISGVEFNNKRKFLYVTGIDPDSGKIFTEMHADIKEGRELRKADKFKAIATYRYYSDITLFEKLVKIGDKVTVNGKELEIVGLAERIGSSQDDSQLWVPLDTQRELFQSKDELSTILIETSVDANVDSVAETVKKRMRTDRNEKKNEESFEVQTSAELIASFQTILSIVEWVLIGIAAISLLVGGIGIMNTMYTSVLERTNEIGVMKAIGAKNSDILIMFLIESGLIGFIGGIVGAIIGAGLSAGIGYIASKAIGTTLITPAYPLYLILGSIAFSFVVGTISGTLPAVQASRLKPVEALRYE